MSKQAQPNDLRLATSARNAWHQTVPLDTTIEDLIKPSFWAHIANKLQPADRIEVDFEDGSWLADIRVNERDATWAKIQVLNQAGKVAVASGDAPDEPEDDYKVEWSGRHTKYRVVRLSDKAVLQTMLPSKLDAEVWLRDHKKALAA